MGKILDAIRKEQAQEHRAEVKKIVEADSSDDKLLGGGSPGGFAGACAQSLATKIKRQTLAATQELQDNPSRVRTPAALHGFRAKYSAVPTVELDKIIREYST
jgi:hypothetical protein